MEDLNLSGGYLSQILMKSGGKINCVLTHFFVTNYVLGAKTARCFVHTGVRLLFGIPIIKI